MPIHAWLLLVYCAAVLSQLALRFIVPGRLLPLPTNPFLIIAAVAAEALGPFVVAGILPMIYWAIRKFRPESTVEVVVAWVALMGVFVYLEHYGLTHLKIGGQRALSQFDGQDGGKKLSATGALLGLGGTCVLPTSYFDPYPST
jgi:hypothetical protein